MNKINPLKYKEHFYNGKVFPEAILSKDGVVIEFSKLHNQVQSLPFINTIWNDNNFKQVHLPLNVGTLRGGRKLFSYPNDIRVLDMPIKFPHNSEYRIPRELSQFLSVINYVAQYEASINEKLEDYYCYITIDQKIVEKEKFTRKGGLHVDGFQGARIKEPLPVDHSYFIVDKMPTIFYNQEFEVLPHWDRNCHNYFEGFALQAKEENKVTYPPYSILLANAYCLHEAPMAHKNEYRTFFRMSYTVREFDRLGNAHNPMFDYEWEMLPRDTQSGLVCPIKGL